MPKYAGLRDSMTDHMNTREVAAYLRIKERKVYDLVAKKQIPCTRVGGKWLFPRDRIDAWLEHEMSGSQAAEPAPPPPPPPVVAGSHDPLLDWALRESGSGLAFLSGGSMAGLKRLAAGEALAAGMHVLADDGETYNVAAVQSVLKARRVVLIRWAEREQGLLLPKGNPLGIASVKDMAAKGTRVVPRQEGAGSQILLEYLLRQAGIGLDDLNLESPAGNESELGRAVASCKADCGVGLKAVAAEYGLEFLPLRRERYDLAVGRRDYFEAPFQALLAFAATPAFRDRAAEMPGYDITGLGGVVYNGP